MIRWRFYPRGVREALIIENKGLRVGARKGLAAKQALNSDFLIRDE